MKVFRIFCSRLDYLHSLSCLEKKSSEISKNPLENCSRLSMRTVGDGDCKGSVASPKHASLVLECWFCIAISIPGNK